MDIIITILVVFIIETFFIFRIKNVTLRIFMLAELVTLFISLFYFNLILMAIFGDKLDQTAQNSLDGYYNLMKWVWGIAGVLILWQYTKKNTFFSNFMGNSTPSKEIPDSLTLSGKQNLMGTPKMNTVIFLFAKTSPIKIISPDFASIAHSIIQEFGRNQFAPSELQNHFLYIKNQYPKLVNQEEYRQILDICNRFVDEGGRLELTLS